MSQNEFDQTFSTAIYIGAGSALHLHDRVRVLQRLLCQVPLTLDLQLKALRYIRHQHINQAADPKHHVL